MNIIEEKRRNVLEETTKYGQRSLLDFLEKLLPTTDEIIFNTPLQGDIDFSVLKTCGFDNITAIVFESGNVTSIRNLPDTIKRLVIRQNLLVDLVDLPQSLVELNAAGNGLRNLDLSELTNLSTVDVDDNALVVLKLPKSITELTCNNNKLRELDLDNLTQLRILKCMGNPLMSIVNYQDTIQKFVMENNPALEIRRQRDMENESKDDRRQAEIGVDVNEAIHKYFKLKEQYEDNVRTIQQTIYASLRKKSQAEERRRVLRETKYPCVNCTRPVGTVFECKYRDTNGRKYLAKCGDAANPCNLDIRIHMVEYDNLNDTVQMFREAVADEHENIIKTKLDALFNYISEKDAVAKYKKLVTNAAETSDVLRISIEKYNELYYNDELNHRIRQKSLQIFELQEKMRKMLQDYHASSQTRKSNRAEQMHDIMTLYTTELVPEYKTLQNMKYQTMEMDDKKLVQMPTTVAQLDFKLGKSESKVVAFVA